MDNLKITITEDPANRRLIAAAPELLDVGARKPNS
jgi:hypothetical protein